jgi:hypothetical protein
MDNERDLLFVVWLPCGTWNVGQQRKGYGEIQLTLEGDNIVHCHRQKAPRRRFCWGWLWWLRKAVVYC